MAKSHCIGVWKKEDITVDEYLWKIKSATYSEAIVDKGRDEELGPLGNSLEKFLLSYENNLNVCD